MPVSALGGDDEKPARVDVGDEAQVGHGLVSGVGAGAVVGLAKELNGGCAEVDGAKAGVVGRGHDDGDGGIGFVGRRDSGFRDDEGSGGGVAVVADFYVVAVELHGVFDGLGHCAPGTESTGSAEDRLLEGDAGGGGVGRLGSGLRADWCYERCGQDEGDQVQEF